MAQECKINFTLKTNIIHHIDRIKEKIHLINSIDVEIKLTKKLNTTNKQWIQEKLPWSDKGHLTRIL